VIEQEQFLINSAVKFAIDEIGNRLGRSIPESAECRTRDAVFCSKMQFQREQSQQPYASNFVFLLLFCIILKPQQGQLLARLIQIISYQSNLVNSAGYSYRYRLFS